mmetsp:Transcript_27759/g.62752  ORF Transcript_27759/g.62752 Transcript_27759/m.62752 type:complete len:427 (-) Transcript_27759:126-1406(-)
MQRSAVAVASVLLLAFSCGPVASAALTDENALLQTASHQLEPKPRKPLCTKEELTQFNAAVDARKEAMLAISKKREAEEMAKFKKTVTEVGAALNLLAKPFLDAGMQAFDAWMDAFKPAVLEMMKFVTMHVVKPNTPYANIPDAAQEHEILRVAIEAMGPKLKPAEEQILLNALRSVDTVVEDRIRTAFPQMGGNLTSLPPYPTTLEGCSEYVLALLTDKVAPLMIVEAFPQLETTLSVLLQRPKDPSEFSSYLVNVVWKRLPRECQMVTESIAGLKETEGEFALGGMIPKIMQLESVIASCGQIILPKMAPEKNRDDDVPPEPRRTCATCEEDHNAANDECGESCLPLFFSIIGGVNEKFMKSTEPCLRCHREAMANLDQCNGDDKNAWVLRKIDAMKQTLENGSFEEADISAFTEALYATIFKA